MLGYFKNWRFWIAALLAFSVGWKAYADGMSGGGSGGGSSTPYVAVSEPYVSGNFYNLAWATTSAAGSVQAVGTIYCEPSYIKQSIHIDQLILNVTTLFSGGNIQAAIYNDNAGTPGTLINSSASVLTTTTGQKTMSITSSAITGPTNIWACEMIDNATAVLRSIGSTTGNPAVWTLGNNAAANLDGSGGVVACITFTGQTFGTWPNLTSVAISAYATTAVCPVFLFHVASVP